jgi:predicted dehydrogenase
VNPLRVGLLGCGGVGARHAAALSALSSPPGIATHPPPLSPSVGQSAPPGVGQSVPPGIGQSAPASVRHSVSPGVVQSSSARPVHTLASVSPAGRHSSPSATLTGGERVTANEAPIEAGMKLVACCGRDEAKIAAFAAQFGGTPYTDFHRMLGEAALDLLIVALPPYAHGGEVEAAAKAGVHVLVEKPIALSLGQARSMTDAASDAGIVAACGFMYRFGDAVERWNQAAAAGETGRAGLFAGHFHCNALHADWWRERARSGGQMVEQLIHIVDLARHQLGEPQTVYARAANFFHQHTERYDSDDVSAIVLGYDDGRVGVLNATNGAIPGKWDKQWHIVAERMTGRFTAWNSAVLTRTDGDTRTEIIDTQTDVFVAQLADIAAAIRQRRAPRVPLADGERTLRIVLAAVQSAAERREIHL